MAIVFRAPDGRRFFTEKAAYNRAMWLELRRDFGPCECGEGNCELHDTTDFEKAEIIARMKQEDCERTVPVKPAKWEISKEPLSPGAIRKAQEFAAMSVAYQGPAERLAAMEGQS